MDAGVVRSRAAVLFFPLIKADRCASGCGARATRLLLTRALFLSLSLLLAKRVGGGVRIYETAPLDGQGFARTSGGVRKKKRAGEREREKERERGRTTIYDYDMSRASTLFSGGSFFSAPNHHHYHRAHALPYARDFFILRLSV